MPVALAQTPDPAGCATQQEIMSANGQSLDARRSGTFVIGGEITIHRLGFGAMRITGDGMDRFAAASRGRSTA